MDKIERVEKGDDFLTFTPKSEQEFFAESQLMQRVHELSNPHVADDAWRSGFMPEGALVQEKASGAYFFVVRAYWCAVLLWAAKQREINMFVRDPAAASLEWRVVLDFADWDVCSVDILSPLHCVLKDSPLIPPPLTAVNSPLFDCIQCTAHLFLPTRTQGLGKFARAGTEVLPF